MALSEQVISESVDRYWRERDRYLKLATFVADKCQEMIETGLLRATVSFRAKDTERLRGKLRKQARLHGEEPGLETVDDVFAWVSDLAGVRIATYLERDRAVVVDRLRSIFVGPEGQEIDVEVKDRPGELYRATHCQVALPPEALVGTYENLSGLTCEIQVCSLLAHVSNEIDHDVRYKPMMGPISDNEAELLDALGNLTVSGEVIVKAIIEAQEQRQSAIVGEFQNEYDFVVRMRGKFPGAPNFADHAYQLYEELLALRLNSPAAIDAALLDGDYLARSSQLLQDLQSTCETDNPVVVTVDPGSSDALLVLLLERYARQIEERHPAGRGRGRPSRIRSLATRVPRRSGQDKTRARAPAT